MFILDIVEQENPISYTWIITHFSWKRVKTSTSMNMEITVAKNKKLKGYYLK